MGRYNRFEETRWPLTPFEDVRARHPAVPSFPDRSTYSIVATSTERSSQASVPARVFWLSLYSVRSIARRPWRESARLLRLSYRHPDGDARHRRVARVGPGACRLKVG